MSFTKLFDLKNALMQEQAISAAQDFISREIIRGELTDILKIQIDSYVRVQMDVSIGPEEKRNLRQKLSDSIRQELSREGSTIEPGWMSLQMGLLDRAIKNAQQSAFRG